MPATFRNWLECLQIPPFCVVFFLGVACVQFSAYTYTIFTWCVSRPRNITTPGLCPRISIISKFCPRQLTSVTCHAYYNYLVLCNAYQRSFPCLSCKQFSEHNCLLLFKASQVKSEYYYQPTTEQDGK